MSESLIGAVETPVEAESVKETEGEKETSVESVDASAWSDFFGDDIDESGLILGKYKSPQDLVKGYNELSAKVREKFPEPPESIEDYLVDFSDIEDLKNITLDKEDPLFSAMAPTFKELKLSKDQVKNLMAQFFRFENQYLPDLEAERKKLGGEADEVIRLVDDYVAKENDPDLLRLAKYAGTNAGMLKAFSKLLNKSKPVNIPDQHAKESAPKMSAEELEKKALALKAEPDFNYNEAKREQYETLMKQAIAQERQKK